MKYHARCGKGFDILSNMALHMDKCPKCNKMLERRINVVALDPQGRPGEHIYPVYAVSIEKAEAVIRKKFKHLKVLTGKSKEV